MPTNLTPDLAYDAWLGIKPCGAAHDFGRAAFQAGAAYGRAQQPQSAEAVAFAVFDGPWIEDHTADKNRAEQWAEEGREVVALYTAPQPSAGVVMPGRAEVSVRYGYRSMGYAEGWNDCLDEVASLNGKEVGQ